MHWIFSLAFIILIGNGSLSAQNRLFEHSQNLTITEGLAHNGVTSILRDRHGYFWFGTYDGLSKYDGYEFETFKNTIDEDFLISNRVRTISEDVNGNLWIGTDEGISIYDYNLGQFRDLYSHKSQKKGITGPIVRKILFSNDSSIAVCVTEGDGVLFFDLEKGFLSSYFPHSDISRQKVNFFDGLALDQHNYLFASTIGLLLFNYETGDFRHVLKSQVGFSNAIKLLDEETILITLLNGVAVLGYGANANSYDFRFYRMLLEEYQFNTIAKDVLENVWLGSFNQGIVHVKGVRKLKSGEDIDVSTYNEDAALLRVSSIFPTTNQGCWIGTFNKGILRFNLKENPFKSYNTSMRDPQGLISNEVLHISAYDSSRALITANRGGIGLFNSEKGHFEALPFDLPNVVSNRVGAVFVDSEKNSWVKLGGSPLLGRFRKNIKDYEPISIGSENDFTSIRAVHGDKSGRKLWLGSTEDVFLVFMDIKGKVNSVERLSDNPFMKENPIHLVRRIYVDPAYNFVWVGTDANGLYRIKVEGDKPLHLCEILQFVPDPSREHSISSNFVTSMIRLPNDEFWIGTERGGICKVLKSDSDKPHFLPFTEKNGLSNNVVKNILVDREYNLWISTNIGLNKFDTKSFVFRSFTKTDGLPFQGFGYGATSLDNGGMIFGGFEGFCYFHPEEITNSEVLPQLEIDKLKIFGESISPGDTVAGRILLEKALTDVDQIQLKYNENVFSMDLVSLHYSNPNNHYIKYQLLPINSEWIEVRSGQKTIYYNGLQPGEYTLRVMASNSLNQWTEPKELKIKITPPFWETTLAYLIYVLFAVIIAYMVIRIMLQIQSLKHKVELEHLEVETANKINAAKLRFFSNISHEIKTPLTLISGPVDFLAQRYGGTAEVKDKLDIVQRQSKKISQLVDQVHDFQRAEANLLKMNFNHFRFDEFLKELIADFTFLAENDKKSLKIKSNCGQVLVSADRDKLEKIFNNLLNNAFKFTNKGDEITVEYYLEGKDLFVNVSDTGRGIDKEDLPRIFERFYQSTKKDSAYSGGSGIGLAFAKRLVEMHYGYIEAESELGVGTRFKVRLPIVKEELPAHQQEREAEILGAEAMAKSEFASLNQIDVTEIKTDETFRGARIFFAEDNTEMRMFVSEVLSNFFTVKAFANGGECLTAMEDEWPEIVISDVLMPLMNGFELCRSIKSDIKTSHIPIILLTACTAIDDQIEGVQVGADAYIQKPFNLQHLVARIESLLKGRQKLRERFQIDFPLALDCGAGNGNDAAFLEKLYSLMAENLDNEELDLNIFARELYLNRTHFYQKVKALTNQTPFELLKMYRLKKAAEFLVQGKMSVNEVYMNTGFKSRTHFSKLFKETYDVSPGKYGAEARKKYSSN